VSQGLRREPDPSLVRPDSRPKGAFGVSRALRNAVLVVIGVTVATSLSSCGSGGKATRPDPGARPGQASKTDRSASSRNWYRVSPRAIASADWGRVRASEGLLEFTLGPSQDRRRRHELEFGRVVFTEASITVADDQHGTHLVRLEGESSLGCLFHAQGDGVNVVIATRRCVPIWATTGHRTPARMWIRVQNVGPHPKVVYMEYEAFTA
jgi:hypothetical protein